MIYAYACIKYDVFSYINTNDVEKSAVTATTTKKPAENKVC